MTEDWQREMARRLRGEARFDDYSRVLYSTDASIYEIEPIGVVLPRDAEDLHAAVELCAANGVAMLPRGGGTSLAGQAVGHCVHFDFSKYMHGILEINAEEKWVRVQPGVVLDQLNAALRPYGLMFGPDVAPSNRATLGGMIGNNSCGTRSIVYGKTSDHVLDLTVVLPSGRRLRLGSHDSTRLHQQVTAIVEGCRQEISERFPRIQRRVSGYNLDMIMQGGGLARLICGSEGTLAVVEEAKLRLVDAPRRTGLLVVAFKDMDEALAANEVAIQHPVSAVELLDHLLLDMARRSIEFSRHLWFVEDEKPTDMLFVECMADNDEELNDKLAEVRSQLEKRRLGRGYRIATDEDSKASVIKVRKAGLPLLMGLPGDRKPVAFVEDTAVAPERLAEFVGRFRGVVESHGTQAAFYAHASVGCLHIRPLLNLKDPREVRTMRVMADEIFELVREYGGSMSGEHGDGLSRSMFNERLFGPVVYQAFVGTKRLFDPRGLMNPGKIVGAPDMTENLRYAPGYPKRQIQTHLNFSNQEGYGSAVELCNGSGVCRKTSSGTMCPSYMVTMEEEHSTRGRANVLRAVLSGRLPADAMSARRAYQVMELCIGCKACKSECPSNVDMARLKFEFLSQYYQRNPVPLRSRLFSHAELLGWLGTLAAPLANRMLETPLLRDLMHRYLGIERRRHLPPFADRTFTSQLADLRPDVLMQSDLLGGKVERTVALFVDTFMEYHAPAVGVAALRVLEAGGYRVVVPAPACCGRPSISMGLHESAWEHGRMLIESFGLLVADNCDIVGCEPSCVTAIRDDYRSLLPPEMVAPVADRTFLLEEFLLRAPLPPNMFKPLPARALVHVHCQQKALIGTDATLQALRLIPQLEVELVDGGCCGMAGSFGYEKEHYDISLAMGERRLLPAVRAHGNGIVVASGVSCRQQIEHATGKRALHPAEVLASALAQPGRI